MGRPKILILTGALPYPLVTGAKIRTFNLMKILAREFDLSLLTIITGAAEHNHISTIERAGIKCHALFKPGLHGTLKKSLDAVLSYLSPRPYLTRHYCSRSYRRLLDTLHSQHHYDVIHCDSISMTANLQGLDQSRLVLTAHNIEQMIWAGYAEHAGNPLTHAFYKNQYRKVRRLERRLDDVYGHIVTVSAHDKQVLQDHFAAERITVVENGVDPGIYENTIPVENRAGIIFTGSLDWHPNLDGLNWFAHEVYPILRATQPGLQVKIVGRHPSKRLTDLLAGRTAMTLHADVPEIQPHLHAARVMMVPLRIGGGSRLKILEAMASGVPVVSTTKGAEGLEVTPGEHLLIEDDPARFAEVLVNVMEDVDLNRRLAERGLELVKNRYSWEKVARPQADLWRRIAGD